jgi:hypothetical protein
MQPSSLNSTAQRLLQDLLQQQQQPPSASMQTSAGPSQPPSTPPPAAAVAAASSLQHADTEMSAEEDGPAQHNPAAESAAAPASPASPAAASAGSPSSSAPSPTKQWTPLLDWIVQYLMSNAGAPSREAALEALHVTDSLVCLPNLYTHLNELLRHKKVRNVSAHSDSPQLTSMHWSVQPERLSCVCMCLHAGAHQAGRPEATGP